MSIRTDVETALDGLRQGFQADGADLTVEDATAERVTLRLVGGPETCWECIVAPDQLRDVVGSVLRGCVDGLAAVEVIDPRERRTP
jgi:Fe-S cluster biogenesis protein NfuA